ncbi:hypothetical protein [Streptomyces flaveolus]|uniref:hypothetical protein n=1 Tax=Streptomyces flaveolus TaxID=67297 RepID=UPI00368E6091
MMSWPAAHAAHEALTNAVRVSAAAALEAIDAGLDRGHCGPGAVAVAVAVSPSARRR